MDNRDLGSISTDALVHCVNVAICIHQINGKVSVEVLQIILKRGGIAQEI